jgi:hypothetical protein
VAVVTIERTAGKERVRATLRSVSKEMAQKKRGKVPYNKWRTSDGQGKTLRTLKRFVPS